jgi:hypothetical protein
MSARSRSIVRGPLRQAAAVRSPSNGQRRLSASLQEGMDNDGLSFDVFVGGQQQQLWRAFRSIVSLIPVQELPIKARNKQRFEVETPVVRVRHADDQARV